MDTSLKRYICKPIYITQAQKEEDSKGETICFLRFQALVLICGGAHYDTT